MAYRISLGSSRRSPEPVVAWEGDAPFLLPTRSPTLTRRLWHLVVLGPQTHNADLTTEFYILPIYHRQLSDNAALCLY